MVCDSCQTKVNRIAVPDKWKEGSRHTASSSSSTARSSSGPAPVVGGVRPGKTNKLLNSQKVSAQWLPSESKCMICKG